jgi:hypothetical protein
MDEQEFIARAAQYDAQAIAAAVGGQVTSDPQQFLDQIRAAWRTEPDADTRTVEQVADQIGQLYQRFLDAWWYGSSEQTQQAARTCARALKHPASHRLYVHAIAVQVGDYIRAVG